MHTHQPPGSPRPTVRMAGHVPPRRNAPQRVMRAAAMAVAVPAALVAVGALTWWLRVTGREAVRA